MVRPRWRLATLIPLAVTAATVVLTARPIESNETDPHGPPGAQCAGTAGECVGENELPPQFDAMDRPAEDDEGETSSSSEVDDEGEEGEEEYNSSSGSVLFGSEPSNGDPRESRTLAELWSNLRCNDVFEAERPIPTKELFSAAIALYNSIQDDPELRIENKGAGGIFVELEVRQAGDKGRGIFALEDIPKGARWRSSYDFTAMFYHPNHYGSFLLGLERGTACDVMQWAYAEWDAVTDEAYIGVDLDEATMCNDGGEGSNVGCDEEDPDMDMDCMAYHYATRDIKKGEEILCDYGWHSGSAWEETVWEWKLDPVHEKAWKRLRRFAARVRSRTSQIRRKLLSKREASVGN